MNVAVSVGGNGAVDKTQAFGAKDPEFGSRVPERDA